MERFAPHVPLGNHLCQDNYNQELGDVCGLVLGGLFLNSIGLLKKKERKGLKIAKLQFATHSLGL